MRALTFKNANIFFPDFMEMLMNFVTIYKLPDLLFQFRTFSKFSKPVDTRQISRIDNQAKFLESNIDNLDNQTKWLGKSVRISRYVDRLFRKPDWPRRHHDKQNLAARYTVWKQYEEIEIENFEKIYKSSKILRKFRRNVRKL